MEAKKKELNEILMKNEKQEGYYNTGQDLFYFNNNLNPLNEDDELDNTVKYDSDDNLSDTVDFSENNNENIVLKEPQTLNSFKKEEEISSMWLEVLKFIENNELDEAYEKVLNSGDDIYLIRLMMKTGSCIKKLRRKTAVLLLKRLAQIGKSNFLNKICLNFLDDFKDKKAKEALKIEDQRKILDALEKIKQKKGNLESKAQNLSDYYIKSFK